MAGKTRELVDRFIDSVETQRFDEAYNLLNADGRFVLTGKTEASGVYATRDEVFARLAPKLTGFTELPKIKVIDFLVDGDRAFLRAVGAGAGAFGPYEQPHYGYYLRVEGDGFAEIVEYLDTVELEVAVYGKKLVPA